MVSRIKLYWFTLKTIKEVIIMMFTQKTQLVKSLGALVLAGSITFDEVPDLFNLREQVAIFLGLEIIEE